MATISTAGCGARCVGAQRRPGRRIIASAFGILVACSLIAACGDGDIGDLDATNVDETTADGDPTSTTDTASPTMSVDADSSDATAADGDETDGSAESDMPTSTTIEPTDGDGKDAPVSTEPDDDDDRSTTTGDESGSEPDDATYDPGLEPLVNQAKEDLAGRLGVDTGAVRVVSAELVQWPNAAAGCPQPGMQYAQVVTDGSEIVLAASGDEYRYTTGGSSYTPTLCEN